MLRDRGGSERGSVAITVALALTVLLGLAALVVDVGLNWAARTSAQTAADSAALAGASSLLSDGGVAAITTVETFLNQNVGGLVELPDDAGWATDGDVGNGEVVCWTMPNPVPGPGATCPDGSNALQVTTPPIVVRYAFAPLLGKTTSSIRARAAAGAGPAAPNNCVLCVLEPTAPDAPWPRSQPPPSVAGRPPGLLGERAGVLGGPPWPAAQGPAVAALRQCAHVLAQLAGRVVHLPSPRRLGRLVQPEPATRVVPPIGVRVRGLLRNPRFAAKTQPAVGGAG